VIVFALFASTLITLRLSFYQKLSLTENECFISEVPSPGPGNVVMIEYCYQKMTEIFTGFGKQRKSRFKVFKEAINGLQKYLETNAPIVNCLVDQLLIPFVLAECGEFYTSK